MMHKPESQDISEATTYVQSVVVPYFFTQADTYEVITEHNQITKPDDMIASYGQSALESARILLLSASATSTSILKNLVLPGIGHFTILDHTIASSADAGNNFFLNGLASVGKPRAQEAVPLLCELNESVDGVADTRRIKDVLDSAEGGEWIKNFSLVIAHNLNKDTLDSLSKLLWENSTSPPLIVVHTAGFLAEFYIQFHEHCIIESHSETSPSLRLTAPFPELKIWAKSLDYDNLDPTDHAHIPFAVILVKEVEKWKDEHNGKLPLTYAEKCEFKEHVRSLQHKIDEENFEEAEAQAWRLWSEKPVPSDVEALFTLPQLSSSSTDSGFHALLKTLKLFVESQVGSGHLPLTSTLPDMKTDTTSYVKLQNLYREQSKIENAKFKEIFKQEFPDLNIDEAMIDVFVKNAHQIKVLRGQRYGSLEPASLAGALEMPAEVDTSAKSAVTHLALSALTNLLSQGSDESSITPEALEAEVRVLAGQSVTLPERELNEAVGEIARAPKAELPNTSAFLGGLVAQEAIKMITQQYVPVNGYCVVDLVGSWTKVVGTP